MKRVLAINGAIVACAFVASAGMAPGPLRMLAAGLLVLVLPGLGTLGAFSRMTLDLPRLALAVVGMSSAASVLGAVLLANGTSPPSAAVQTGWVLLVANAGLWAFRAHGRIDPVGNGRGAAAVAVAGFLAASCAGLWLVPPLEDHDMEIRGTAWGLLTERKPWFLTNREQWLPMAHPLLFHVQVAQSLVFTGEIEATRRSYESAREAERASRDGMPFDSTERWRQDHAAFVAEPALAGTRAPSAVFAGLALALLFDLVSRLARSRSAGFAACVLYACAPETIVRAAYAGYFAPAVFWMLVAAGLFSSSDGVPRAGECRTDDLGWFAAAGGLLAWTDHKTVALILGTTAWFGWRALRDAGSWVPRSLAKAVDLRAVALGAGFTAATLAWWGYGLATDRHAFVEDHLRKHVIHRALMDDIRLGSSQERYAPGIGTLWREFSDHTGWFLLPVGLCGIVVWLRRRPARGDAPAVLAVWALSIAVVFSVTDWRQTKHLMNALAPWVAAAVVFAWTARSRGVRAAAVAALILVLGWNAATDVALLRDFRSLTITGASDVDGW